jgi:excisionase family DNA binding protein
MPRMRTINQAVDELKREDPGCALTKNALRQMVLKKRIPSVMVGSKYLVNLDTIRAYFENLSSDKEPELAKIRKIC